MDGLEFGELEGANKMKGKVIFQGDSVIYKNERWGVMDVDRRLMLLKIGVFDERGLAKKYKWVRDELCEYAESEQTK